MLFVVIRFKFSTLLTSHSIHPQLLPSPKWKLVVDVGETEAAAAAQAGQNVAGTAFVGNNANASASAAAATATSAAGGTATAPGAKDRRIDEVVSLLGELMPSDPASSLAPYLSGFMSLRLLLLRPTRSPEEEEHARTMLDSYTSYSQGGRSRSDIGMMLARDYMFLLQQKAQQPAPFFSIGQGMASHEASPALPGYSVFDIHNSPTLGPISIGDSMSIVSN